MGIPDYETLLYPILKFLADKGVKRTREIIKAVINLYDISPEEAKTFIPSGRAKLIDNRVGWACTSLRKAGLIASPQRGENQITEEGLNVLSQNLESIDNKFLKQYIHEAPSEQEVISATGVPENPLSGKTPEEIIGLQSEIINTNLSKELLEYIAKIEPEQFEQLVVDLLLAMGYGGTVEDAGRAVGRTNDGGVDGVIKEDTLGFDTIYLQAKRWQKRSRSRKYAALPGLYSQSVPIKASLSPRAVSHPRPESMSMPLTEKSF